MKAKERNDLIVSWLTISAAFAILLTMRIRFPGTPSFVEAFALSAIVVGTGFIAHELAHRQVAKKFGAHAEYRAWPAGLAFALVSAVFGFIFAAPGAVYIYGNINVKENGIISVAGPVTNIAIALVFLGLSALSLNSWTNLLGMYGFSINMFLALFNMLPIGPLDGRKVFLWDPRIWAVVFVPLAIAFFFL